MNGKTKHHEEHHEEHHEAPRAAQAESKPAQTRKFIPADEKTHFTFSIELPIAWQGPLKRRSIDEQDAGAFHTTGRENDAQALLRHVIREYCEEVVEAATRRRG